MALYAACGVIALSAAAAAAEACKILLLLLPDHMPLEMRILLSAAAPPSPPLPPVQQHTPTWLWDGAKQEQYALALQAGPCPASLQQSCEAAAAGDLQQADGHFNTALKTAAQMAGLRQTRPQSSQPPRLSGRD